MQELAQKIQADLLTEIEAFRLAQGWRQQDFYRECGGDGGLISRLRRNEHVTTATVERICQSIRAKCPRWVFRYELEAAILEAAKAFVEATADGNPGCVFQAGDALREAVESLSAWPTQDGNGAVDAHREPEEIAAPA